MDMVCRLLSHKIRQVVSLSVDRDFTVLIEKVWHTEALGTEALQAFPAEDKPTAGKIRVTETGTSMLRMRRTQLSMQQMPKM